LRSFDLLSQKESNRGKVPVSGGSNLKSTLGEEGDGNRRRSRNRHGIDPLGSPEGNPFYLIRREGFLERT